MTDIGWAGRGFTGPPAAPDPVSLRGALREILVCNGMVTLTEFESMLIPQYHRNDIINTLAAMRDDGEVRFEGPRYVLVQQEDEIQPLHQWRPKR